jgi:vitamin B12 transporter
MNVSRRHRASLAGASFAIVAATQPGVAQSPEPPASENAIVVTPLRGAARADAVGSSVTVINRADIEKWGSAPVIEILRGTPGVTVNDRGGQGSVSGVSLRGGTVTQTLVLIDGIRAGDPSQIGSDFDFGNLLPTDIERIEILRGPQSALYGSDAMGGVINIITRKGAGRPKAEVSVEGGSYGTAATRGSVSGGTEAMSYAFSLAGLHTDGFSRYGYRIGRITSGLTSPLERDPTDKFAGSARLSFRPGDGVEIEAGLTSYLNAIKYDDSTGDNPFNRQRALVTQGWVKGSVESFGGINTTALTLFDGRTDRRIGSYYAGYPALALDYRGDRYGAELQNDTKLGRWGVVTLGARTETETNLSSTDDIPRGANRVVSVDQNQVTHSVFALHRLPVNDRFDVSLGGRIDAVDTSKTFATWRGTAAYRIAETGTKLRASLGTGAKAPSLYQLYNPYRATTTAPSTLSPETSIGGDIGIDQSLPYNLGTVSATVFYNKYRNLISFHDLAYTPTYIAEYYNVNRAETKGIESSLDLVLVPGEWRTRGSYTFLLSEDTLAHHALLQRPQHQGAVSLIYSGLRNLELEGRLVMVGHRIDFLADNQSVRLAPYARLDALARYRINETFSVFARAENLTNAHYQTVYNYGTPGRSGYLGVKVSW